jgi:hypothetical protein
MDDSFAPILGTRRGAVAASDSVEAQPREPSTPVEWARALVAELNAELEHARRNDREAFAGAPLNDFLRHRAYELDDGSDGYEHGHVSDEAGCWRHLFPVGLRPSIGALRIRYDPGSSHLPFAELWLRDPGD